MTSSESILKLNDVSIVLLISNYMQQGLGLNAIQAIVKMISSNYSVTHLVIVFNQA